MRGKIIRRRVMAAAVLERTAQREIGRALLAMIESAASRVATGGDWRGALGVGSGPLANAIERACKRAAIAGAQDVQGNLPNGPISRKAGVQPAMVSQFVLSWVRRHSVKRVSQITKTTERAIRRQIIDGTRRGDSPATIAQAIKEATVGEIGTKRAARIARTETHTAFERGSYEQARELSRMGLQMVAQWGATEDSRTRPDHSAADGQEIDFGQTFTVGGEAMRFPGDPRASARQVVNCRCSALYYPKGAR